MSRKITTLLVALGALVAVLLPATAANAQPNHTTFLQGPSWCSGDVPSPGAWVDAGWGRIRVCVSVFDRTVEADLQDTRTDGYCVDARFNEFATTSGAFKSFYPGTYVGSTRSCGAISHFVTNVADVYDAVWQIRLYRSTAFKLALDTHVARPVSRLIH